MSFEQETRRLRLRRPTDDDLDGYVTPHSDPRTYAHAPASMPDPERCQARLRRNLDDWEQTGFGYVAVEERATGRLVGCGGVKPTPDSQVVNLYYRLSHDVLGRGYGRELARAVVASAIEELPDRVVQAVVKPHNHASLLTALSAGLVKVGTKAQPGEEPSDSPSLVLEPPRFTSLRRLDQPTANELLDVWIRVNEAGGAVGFVPGTPRALVVDALAVHEAAMSAGNAVLGLLRDPHGRLLGFGWWDVGERPAIRHVAHLWRLQVDPEAHGRNTGRLLLAGMHGVARTLPGVELLTLEYRSGLGLGDFYARMGWVETGRGPGAIRFAPDDPRDNVQMMRRVDGAPLVYDGRT